MSSHSLSLAALCLAGYTWWSSPPQQLPQYVEVPVPAAEFSCSARCPAPAQQATAFVQESSSVATALFWTFFGAALFALALLLLRPGRAQRRPSEQVTYLPALAAGLIEEVEPVSTVGVTPQRLRLRQLRALQDAA